MLALWGILTFLFFIQALFSFSALLLHYGFPPLHRPPCPSHTIQTCCVLVPTCRKPRIEAVSSRERACLRDVFVHLAEGVVLGPAQTLRINRALQTLFFSLAVLFFLLAGGVRNALCNKVRASAGTCRRACRHMLLNLIRSA